MKVKKYTYFVIALVCLVFNPLLNAKEVLDFNHGWRFSLHKQQAAHQPAYKDNHWQQVRLPHDWSVALPYTKEGAASTGFKLGGIGWYRKTFNLSEQEQGKVIWLEFDGIYNNSDIWVNGHHVGGRPYGYASFQVNLSQYLNYDGQQNLIAVRVNRTAYADSRWYTGSGIYRNVRLVKANPIYIPQWGIQITTPEVSTENAKVKIRTSINAEIAQGDTVQVTTTIFDPYGEKIQASSQDVKLKAKNFVKQEIEITKPALWSLKHPALHTAQVTVFYKGKIIGLDTATFGIRDIRFDANNGFFLNNHNIKIKGVNLHHDAGAVGAAVPKSVWRSRLDKLKSIGVNALRLSHNPHAPEILQLADEMGFLVNAEAFDDWDRAKKKSKAYLGDNKASGEAAKSYAEHFNVWAERDLKDFIKRDFNHPSIIMWSIGNEIEWTYPYYPKAVSHHEDGTSYYEDAPDFSKSRIMKKIEKYNPDQVDNLVVIANQLSKWVKEVDTSRPVTAGLTHPSVGFATGYADALDLVGFNYRAAAYQKAHETYPNKIIYGSENWGAWREWRDAKDKDYVAGIFIWTGFAYKGEAGPLPRMGLNISLFDFAGNKTPRGHFFETLWQSKPKIWLGTTAAQKSEFSYDKNAGWTFTPRTYPPHIWDKIRMWEWYDVEPIWRYKPNEQVIVQSYTNTESAELFLNGRSLGEKTLTDFDDRVIKWRVPYQQGELKVVGYNQGKKVTESILNTPSSIEQIALEAEKSQIKADGYDTVYLHLKLLDQHGNWVADAQQKVEFTVDGPARILAVDNGSEYNIQDVLSSKLITDRGRATLLLQSNSQTGEINVSAKMGQLQSAEVVIRAQ
ncbi:glycoside hydrolase family 2 TIM barrel-domain containing protein [Catenovulum sediminis]|uniref:Glycoside hydrolase family 2 TIM barrel-domain containing protein n=1 Tax=Catenovulum sediminis TaxID=1740262 RepID=A0ABV1RFL8_9ALTE|nr:glycoside hydrolase family 2 TIM barrel-domain containing protein [Catenovulum sediminis]